MNKEFSPPSLIVNSLARFELFFQENATSESRPLPKPATAKAQSLLVYLVLHRDRPQSRERLVGMFWGDRPDKRARRSLATALWQIRRCFPIKSYIQADVHTVQFAFPGQLQLDAEDFVTAASLPDIRSLEMAVSLYQGDFLDGFYDDWIINERYRLQSQYLEALTRLMHLHEKAGAYEAALETAVRLLDSDSLREEAHRVVMRALLYLGQRNAALKQYTLCRQIIAEELGVEPMPETHQLYQEIRDNRLVAPSSFATVPLPFSLTRRDARSSAGHNPLEATVIPPFVGRDDELLHLTSQWQQALSGESGLLIIKGEAGVGKTRLTESFAEQLHRQGYRVLWGRCNQFERVFPYQPLVEAVRSLLPHLAPPELSAIPDWSLAELSRLLPELLELRPDLDSPSISGLDGEQTSLFTALARALSGLASLIPFLVVVEDLHWAGESTLQLLHFLARQLQSQPILLLGTTRLASAHNHTPLRQFQESLVQGKSASVLNLSRLTAKDAETLVAKMSGRRESIAPLAERLFQETEGNPFFLIELSKSLFENNVLGIESGIWRGDFERISAELLPLPASITNAVQARVHRLPKETQKMLGIAAVLGREFDFAPLHAIWDKGEEATLEGLDRLLRAHLIIEGSGDLGRDFTFTHHKIQEVVYADLPRRLRQHHHARAGQALQTQFAGQESTAAAELAHHFEQGQRLNKRWLQPAIQFLQLAGQEAASQFANAEAEQYFSRALDLTPATGFVQLFDLLSARQAVRGIQGKRDMQAQDIASLQEIAQHLTRTQQAAIFVHEARFGMETSDYAATITSAKAAVRVAKTDKPPDVVTSNSVEGYLLWGQALVRQGDYLDANPILKQALARAQAGQLRKLEADSLNNLGLTHYYLGDYGAAQAHYEEALQVFQEIGARRGQSAVLNNLGVVSNEQGNNVAAAAYYRQALAIHRQTGNRRGECLVMGNLGVIAAAQGSFTEARAYHTQSQVVAREVGHRLFEGNAWLNLGNVSLYLGEYEAAQESYETALSIYRQIGNRVGESWGVAYLSLLAHRLGEQELALAHGMEALRITQEIGDRLIQGYAYTHMGHAYAGLDRLNEAEEAYQEAVTIRRALGEPNLLIESLSGLARVHLVQKKTERALVCVEEMLAYLETHALEGADETLRVYLTCYHALVAHQTPRSRAILEMAHNLLQTQANLIDDEQLRRKFLHNVPAHRDIVVAFSVG